MLISGIIFRRFPPKGINSVVGYRTNSSMKNADTWAEANTYSPVLFILMGLVQLAFALICRFLTGESMVTAIIGIILALTSMLLVFYLTEKHLKKMFDKNEIRK